ncbi:MAG: sugar phosphate isomerase/epimerase [Proteobacteria bacterium]|nr:sugar phosphate isomerase/epimerase [Pseudomonadota bacterium]
MKPAYCPRPPAKSPWVLAAPSFVRPGTVAENCAFLAPLVDEVGLAFFETEACLAYKETDLPPFLADLDLSYHLHLPLDLPWEQGAEAGFAAIATLRQKIAFLSPRSFVLHPHPAAPPTLVAQKMRALGIDPAQVFLENIEGCDLTELWDEILDSGLGVCLDIGHVLTYSQPALLELPGLWERVGMVHASAPDPRQPSRHAGLPLLDLAGRRLLQVTLTRLTPGAVLNLEVFNEDALMASLDFLEAFRHEMEHTA